ncbi:MAG: DUF6231 family protein [Methylophagaceae bacterium]
MTAHSDISTILLPLVAQFNADSILLVGDIAVTSYKQQQDTRLQVLKTPFSLEQLTTIATIDLAIISEVTDILDKSDGIKWLSMLRHCHVQHMIVISESEQAKQQGWQLADYLAMGMAHIATSDNYQIFSYAIEHYRPKKDWLNSRFWANPENYDKYRW